MRIIVRKRFLKFLEVGAANAECPNLLETGSPCVFIFGAGVS